MIRRLTIDDWQLYKEVRLACLKEYPQFFGAKYSTEILKTNSEWMQVMLNPMRKMFGYFVDDELVAIGGFLYVNWRNMRPDLSVQDIESSDLDQINYENWYLASVYSIANYRGKGTVKKLINHLINIHRIHHDNDKFDLVVEANNLVAINLYKTLGFEIMDYKLPSCELADGLIHDEILMRLSFV